MQRTLWTKKFPSSRTVSVFATPGAAPGEWRLTLTSSCSPSFAPDERFLCGLFQTRTAVALDELQSEFLKIHAQGDQRPAQLPLLLPHRGGLQHSFDIFRPRQAQRTSAGRDASGAQGEAGDL